MPERPWPSHCREISWLLVKYGKGYVMTILETNLNEGGGGLLGEVGGDVL